MLKVHEIQFDSQENYLFMMRLIDADRSSDQSISISKVILINKTPTRQIEINVV